MEVDAFELEEMMNSTDALKEVKTGNFSIDACRTMVAIYDVSAIYTTTLLHTFIHSFTQLHNYFVHPWNYIIILFIQSIT